MWKKKKNGPPACAAIHSFAKAAVFSPGRW